ncbi:MAG: hypothetical protein AAF667_09980 [Pseudomonadota bacterium]
MYEYRIVPAPSIVSSGWGLRRRKDAQLAQLSDLMNDMTEVGWEFQRSEFVPAPRSLLGLRAADKHVLVFRRPKNRAVALLPSPEAVAEADRAPKPARAQTLSATAAPPRVGDTDLISKARARVANLRESGVTQEPADAKRPFSPIEAVGGRINPATVAMRRDTYRVRHAPV